MIIALPVFFGENESLWLNDTGWELLGRTFSFVAGLKGTAMVVSSHGQVLELASEAGLQAVSWDKDVSLAYPFPRGTAEAIQAVHERHGTQPVMVLNFANPMLTERVVDQAAHVFATADQPVVSVVGVRDNPCQFRTCLKLAQTMIVNPVDERFQPPHPHGHKVATRVIPMGWDAPAVKPGKYYRRDISLAGSSYVPAGDDDGSPLWFFETADQGRIIFTPDDAMDGAHVWPQEDSKFYCMTRTGDNGSAFVDLVRTGDFSEQCLIKHAPLGVEAGATESILMPATQGELSLELRDETAHGWMVQVYEVISNGPFDASDPFRPEGAAWDFNSSMRCVNVATGQIIQGRQEMPEIVDVDGSILVVGPQAPLAPSNVLADGFFPFVLYREHSLHIETSLDILAYRARSRAVNHAA